MLRTIAPLVLVLAAANTALAEVDRKPNVVVILTDDQGWGDLSSSGNTNLSTPHVDSLAKDGARFDRFYVQPVCSPTRAEFLTGRYHARAGVYSTSAGGERIDLDESTIGETFKAAGYATAAFGKWHNGMQPPYHPNARGFDEYYGFCSGHWGNYFDPVFEHNGRIVRGKGFCIDDFTNRAMAFMEEHADEPFLVYLPYNTPHSPMQVPDRFWEKFENAELRMRHRDAKGPISQHTRAALAMCENVDWNVGRLLGKLDDLELAEDTIVVYFCDNGPNGQRWNGGMKGRKGSTDEGGVRSPLYVRWPRRIPKGTIVERCAAAIDLRPTLAGLCAIPVGATKPLDGRSFRSQIASEPGEPDAWEDRLIYASWRGKLSARNERYLYDVKGALFDLADDPGQRTDVAMKHPDVVRRMRADVERFRTTVLGELGKDDRPFPIGHADFDFTQIPARDATTTGGLQRSNRFPNDSYFTNWTSTEDAITWNAEVLTAGEYEVTMYYTCPRADVGATVELSFGESKVTATIDEPHDPPILGAEHDRVKRQESYVKDFRPMSLGTITLKPGRSTLKLRATKVPGRTVGEFRLLMFHRR